MLLMQSMLLMQLDAHVTLALSAGIARALSGMLHVTDASLSLPLSLSQAFYMRLNDDGKTVAAMDVLFPRVGEMVGGSQR